MRALVSACSLASVLGLCLTLPACDGCEGSRGMSQAEQDQLLASAIAAPTVAPSAVKAAEGDIGHAANVIPGQGPKRVEFTGPRQGNRVPILPGQGIGPIRFGATRQTVERLMGAPCDEASDTRCLYIGRGVDFKLAGGVVTEIRVSRKGREAKRAPDGSVLEYGFFNGSILPDLYFGMTPSALKEKLGAPLKVEQIEPMGPDGFTERDVYDGMTLEYDRWSNGNLVLGAAVLTKSDTAAAKNKQLMDEMSERAKATPPTREPR